ncbi:MAG TPA: hypothetical protein VMU11_01075 [Verrucomicrobiae bacterium]|nr:hypothetical protein [Verrucomicrobiae bacterium]
MMTHDDTQMNPPAEPMQEGSEEGMEGEKEEGKEGEQGGDSAM